MKIKISLALVCAAVFSAGAQASITANEAARPLIKDGDVLTAQGRFQEAVNKFSAAAKADPAASEPISKIAFVLMNVATAGGDNAAKMHEQAEAAARQALRLGPEDPLAQEVLRQLTDDKPLPLHLPSLEAAKLVHEGEVLFQGRRYNEALEKYERAAQADPLYSSAWVYAADCFYLQKNWTEAETRFRKAVAIEPLNSQAWRFLSDALASQGKNADAQAALLNGIAAQPSQRPNWTKLASLRRAAGTPLTSLSLAPKASSALDPATGKYKINVDAKALAPDGKSPDFGAWMMLAVVEVNMKVEQQQGKSTATPYAIELAAWKGALKVADELTEKGGQLTEPGLITMRMLAQADQLDAALLLLRYKESFRPEFEAWKATHPDGIRKFVDTYGLQP